MIHNTIPDWCRPALTREVCVYASLIIATIIFIIMMIMCDMLLVAAGISVAFILLLTNTYIVGTAAVAAYQFTVSIALLVCMWLAHGYVIQLCIAIICAWIMVIALSPIRSSMQDKDISIMVVLLASVSIIVIAILLIMIATSAIDPVVEISLASISMGACCTAMVKMALYYKQPKHITIKLSDMSAFEI